MVIFVPHLFVKKWGWGKFGKEPKMIYLIIIGIILFLLMPIIILNRRQNNLEKSFKEQFGVKVKLSRYSFLDFFSDGKRKKDGTRDLRYKENKYLKD